MDETQQQSTETGGAEARPRGGFIRRGTGAAEHALESAYDGVWSRLRKRPYLGVALAGGAGLALASAIGVGEIAIGAMAGYAAWKMLVERKRPSQALKETVEKEERVRP